MTLNYTRPGGNPRATLSQTIPQLVLTVMASYSPSVKLAKNEPAFLKASRRSINRPTNKHSAALEFPDYAGPAADAQEKRSTRLGQCLLGGIPLREQSFFLLGGRCRAASGHIHIFPVSLSVFVSPLCRQTSSGPSTARESVVCADEVSILSFSS